MRYYILNTMNKVWVYRSDGMGKQINCDMEWIRIDITDTLYWREISQEDAFLYLL